MFLIRNKWALVLRVASTLFIIYTIFLMIGEVKDGLHLREQERIAEQEQRDRLRIVAADMAIYPVQDIVLDYRECLVGEFIVAGLLNKTRYPTPEQAGTDANPTGLEADFISMQVYSDEAIPDRYPWRQTSDADSSPASRMHGEQALDFVVEGPCDLVFDLFTRHKSPLTGRFVDMRWGPFSPDD